MIRPLNEVLAYRNPEVVYRFSEDTGISLDQAEEIFLETKRWLWFCATVSTTQGKDRPIFPLLSEAYAIDQMWHTFLLFTQAYSEFCDTHFGFFVHHHPQTRAEKEKWQEMLRTDEALAKRNRREILRKSYESIYDYLGAETLKKWCEEFPRKFKS